MNPYRILLNNHQFYYLQDSTTHRRLYHRLTASVLIRVGICKLRNNYHLGIL